MHWWKETKERDNAALGKVSRQSRSFKNSDQCAQSGKVYFNDNNAQMYTSYKDNIFHNILAHGLVGKRPPPAIADVINGSR